MQTDLETLRRYEVEQARRTRGFCEHCGHRWRPRNPSQKVNRCPGCGHRGGCSYAVFSDEADE